MGLWGELFDLTARQAATPPADPRPRGPRGSADGALLAALLGLTVRGTLAELADHGAVAITTTMPPDIQTATPAGPALAAIGLPGWAVDHTSGTTARHPLGTWAVRCALLTEGALAPATKAHA
jgi:hypothetical protein